MAYPSEKMSETDNEQISKRLDNIESELRIIKERNNRVEQDKAWETSATRKVSLIIFTYVITSAVFWLISVPRPLVNALIPTTGYFLSTLSLPFIKQKWLARYK